MPTAYAFVKAIVKSIAAIGQLYKYKQCCAVCLPKQLAWKELGQNLSKNNREFFNQGPYKVHYVNVRMACIIFIILPMA